MDSITKTIDSVHSRDSRALRDPVWGHIYIPASFIPLLSSTPFTKIRGIKQLGPCNIVYPGASHDRFSHSLGVYHVASRFLEQFSKKNNGFEFSHEKSLAFLAAALCHDLGHFPYTHSLKELPLKEHETLSAELVQGDELITILDGAGVVPQHVAAIIDHTIPIQDKELLFYRKVLSGVLDPDKLDYLKRDAFYCGVPYGVQDLDFLLSRLQIDPKGTLRLAESDSSIIEHILFSKYLMYKAVYWHRDVRIATAMIKKFLHTTIKLGILDPNRLYNLDDNGFLNLAAQLCKTPGIPDLPSMVRTTRLYSLVWECAFCDLDQDIQSAIENMEDRSLMETKLACIISPPDYPSCIERSWQVILDIPERVGFEVDFPLISRDGTTRPFLESSSVFSARTVHEFTGSLRRIRMLVFPGIECSKELIHVAIKEILKFDTDRTHG